MDVAKTFDPYEVIGVITPGAVMAMMMAVQWPAFRTLLGAEGLSLGGLGMFLLAAFVIGHLIQALGNLIEGLFWLLPGMPSAWVRNPRQRLLSPAQRALLQSRVAAMESGVTDLPR